MYFIYSILKKKLLVKKKETVISMNYQQRILSSSSFFSSYVVLLLFIITTTVHSYKYTLTGIDLTPRKCDSNSDCPSGQCVQTTCVVSFGEVGMFSKKDAPFGANKYTPQVSGGPAFIKFVDTKTAAPIESKRTSQIYLAVTLYHNTNPPALNRLCGDPTTAFGNATGTIPMTPAEEDPETRATYYFKAQSVGGHTIIEVDEISMNVIVTSQVRVLYRICPDGLDNVEFGEDGEIKSSTTTTTTTDELDGRWIMETNLKFINPYGYFSAHLYGLIPFFVVYTICVSIFLLAYLILALKHRAELIGLHYMTLILILITLVGSILYLNAFISGNDTGEPLCYPICGAAYLVAMVVDEIKNTLARLILLVVCLGLGVSKPTLEQNVKIKIAVVHILYFGFSLNDKIHLLTVLDENSDPASALWALPPVLLNIFIILWIYYALTKTMALLVAQGQTFKHKMMTKLSKILAGFILVWSGTTVLLFIARIQIIIWPWQMEWVWFAVWYAIYLCAVMTIGWTWGPSESSSRLAHQLQLRLDDDDDEEDVEIGLEMGNTNFNGSGIVDDGNDKMFSLDVEDDFGNANDDEDDDGNANIKPAAVKK